jgi:hypothetical protein
MTIEAFLLEPNTTITNTGLQGPGSSGSDANNLANNEFLYANQSDYIFPNLNFAVFGEYFQNFLQLFYHTWFSI